MYRWPYSEEEEFGRKGPPNALGRFALLLIALHELRDELVAEGIAGRELKERVHGGFTHPRLVVTELVHQGRGRGSQRLAKLVRRELRVLEVRDGAFEEPEEGASEVFEMAAPSLEVQQTIYNNN